MFYNPYEYEFGKNIINEKITEYCMAEHLNEEYFRYILRKQNLKYKKIINYIIFIIIFLFIVKVGIGYI